MKRRKGWSEPRNPIEKAFEEHDREVEVTGKPANPFGPDQRVQLAMKARRSGKTHMTMHRLEAFASGSDHRSCLLCELNAIPEVAVTREEMLKKYPSRMEVIPMGKKCKSGGKKS